MVAAEQAANPAAKYFCTRKSAKARIPLTLVPGLCEERMKRVKLREFRPAVMGLGSPDVASAKPLACSFPASEIY
jgi:hypothetical protein